MHSDTSCSSGIHVSGRHVSWCNVNAALYLPDRQTFDVLSPVYGADRNDSRVMTTGRAELEDPTSASNVEFVSESFLFLPGR